MKQAKKSLSIWLNGQLVGVWGRKKGEETFQYDSKWLNNKYARALSLSLPFTPFSAQSASPFDLLAEIGRDCVGAIQVLPMDKTPNDIYSINFKPIDDAQVANILRTTVSSGGFGPNNQASGLRLSLAGAQEKTALLWQNDQWCEPQGVTPTTHIFKLPLGLVGNLKLDMRHSVENEWLCSKIVQAFELPIAECEMKQFEDITVLVVKRFDRKLSGDEQAKGISPLQKYQSDGGLGVTDCMKLLEGSVQAQKDRETFFKAQVIFWLLCAIDGHAKNFSIHHLPNNIFRMTPLYDVLSAFPVIGSGKNKLSIHDAKLAMSINSKNKHYKVKEIQKRHLINHATKSGLGEEKADFMINEIASKTLKVIDEVKKMLPDKFPQSVSNAIFSGLQKQSRKLLR